MFQQEDGQNYGFIENPDGLRHKHSDILLLIRGGYWTHHTYFSVHQHRYSIMLSKLEKKWNRLLRSVINFETEYIPKDDGVEDDILDPELNRKVPIVLFASKTGSYCAVALTSTERPAFAITPAHQFPAFAHEPSIAPVH